MSKFDAIIFDLDGTLTVPILDFDLIRREIGLPRGPVWEAIVAMNETDRSRAETILLRHELQAARECELQTSTLHVLRQLGQRKIHLAILTRNCRASWEIVRDRFNLPIERVFAREDGPMKPDPTAVFQLTAQMNVPLERTLVVGDYLFDIQTGQAAGTKTALLVNHGPVPDYAHIADYILTDLADLLTLLDENANT